MEQERPYESLYRALTHLHQLALYAGIPNPEVHVIHGWGTTELKIPFSHKNGLSAFIRLPMASCFFREGIYTLNELKKSAEAETYTELEKTLPQRPLGEPVPFHFTGLEAPAQYLHYIENLRHFISRHERLEYSHIWLYDRKYALAGDGVNTARCHFHLSYASWPWETWIPIPVEVLDLMAFMDSSGTEKFSLGYYKNHLVVTGINFGVSIEIPNFTPPHFHMEDIKGIRVPMKTWKLRRIITKFRSDQVGKWAFLTNVSGSLNITKAPAKPSLREFFVFEIPFDWRPLIHAYDLLTTRETQWIISTSPSEPLQVDLNMDISLFLQTERNEISAEQVNYILQQAIKLATDLAVSKLH